MKRRMVIRCSMYLAIGAAVSLVIALRLANLDAEMLESVPDQRTIERFKREYRNAIPPERFSEFGYTVGQSTGLYSVAGSLFDDLPSAFLVSHVAAGWPMRCIEGTYMIELSTSSQRQFASSMWRVPSDADLGGWTRRMGVWRVPFHLRPLGLLVNSIVYAVIAAAAFRVVRRLYRRAGLDRGLCPACRYNLSGTPAADGWIRCSECGERLASALLSRPRQLPRLWMAPFLLPVAAFALLLFFSAMDWHWLRVNLLYITPLVEPWNVFVMVGAAACLWLLAFSAYDDRDARPRLLWSIAVSLAISIPAFIAVYVATVWFFG